ncbi:hypothetical protein [Methylomonas sp.]|nr:hypothetical protein [Methylomonas sp.]
MTQDLPAIAALVAVNLRDEALCRGDGCQRRNRTDRTGDNYS